MPGMGAIEKTGIEGRNLEWASVRVRASARSFIHAFRTAAAHALKHALLPETLARQILTHPAVSIAPAGNFTTDEEEELNLRFHTRENVKFSEFCTL